MKNTTVKFKGSPVQTSGSLPEKNTKAENFTLTAADLSGKTLADYSGEWVIMNVFPSIDTSVCATSVREFNKRAASLKNTKVLCISKDLPFAQNRFCGAEGIENVEMLSDFRTDFGKRYGILIENGPLKGLLSRAVLVINPGGTVVHREQVPNIEDEPDYEKALAAIK